MSEGSAATIDGDLAGLVNSLRSGEREVVLSGLHKVHSLCTGADSATQARRTELGSLGAVELTAGALSQSGFASETHVAAAVGLAALCHQHAENTRLLLGRGGEIVKVLIKVVAGRDRDTALEPEPQQSRGTPLVTHSDADTGHDQTQREGELGRSASDNPCAGVLPMQLAAAELVAALSSKEEGVSILWDAAIAPNLVSVILDATTAINDESVSGQPLLDQARLRLDCLRAINAIATSESRCTALSQPPSLLPQACIAVAKHKYDIEGTRCAVNILRNLALPRKTQQRLVSVGALDAFYFHLAHKDPNVTVCAAAGLRLLVSTSVDAVLALSLDQVKGLLQLDIEHTHPHCRVEIVRCLAWIQKLAADATETPSSATARIASLLGTPEAAGSVGFLLLAKQQSLQQEALTAFVAGRAAAARGIGADPLSPICDSNQQCIAGTTEPLRQRLQVINAGQTTTQALAKALLDESARVDRVEFVAGTHVKVQNLVKAAQHNGRTGTILTLVPSTDRYVVRLDDGSQLSVKGPNLTQL